MDQFNGGGSDGGASLNTLNVGGGVLGAATISNFTTLTLTGDENISSATFNSTPTSLNLASHTLTLSVAQNSAFRGTVSNGSNGTATLSNVGITVGIRFVGSYIIQGGSFFTLGIASQNVSEASLGNSVVNLNGLTSTGRFQNFGSLDTLFVSATGDISGAKGATNTTGEALGFGIVDFSAVSGVTLTVTAT